MPAAVPFVFHIDAPSDWRPRERAGFIKGWLLGAAAADVADVRARIDGCIFLGLVGLDRPDLATAFPDRPHARQGGFEIDVTWWRGARELALDVVDADGQWREFFRTPVDTSQLPPGGPPEPVLRAALVAPTLRQLYRYHHRDGWRAIVRAADALLAEVLLPVTERLNTPGFNGLFENPGPWINVRYGKFRVTGWLFAHSGPTSRLQATATVGVESRLIFPKERPDVAAEHKDHPHAIRSGFYGLVDVRDNAPSPACLRLFAEMPDGTRRLALARRQHLDRHDEHAGEVPVFRPWVFRLCVTALLRGRWLGRFRVDDWPAARAAIRRLREELAAAWGPAGAPRPPGPAVRRSQQDPYDRWVWHHRMTPRLRAVLAAEAAAAAEGGPLISLVVPAYNTAAHHLRELLDSVRGQLYPRWELCVADDASPQPHVRRMIEEAARTEPRIKPVFRAENGHIAAATNSALAAATGDYVAFLDHDDLLPPDALLHVAAAIRAQPGADYLYTDEDKIDDAGRRFDPQFKGAWSPEMAITHNYTHHLTVIRRSVVEAVGGMRTGFDGAQDLDLFLRCFERIGSGGVVHVPHIGYHWRAHAGSTATRGDQKGYLFDAARRAIAEAIQRRGLRATPLLPDFARDHALCLHQLAWDPAVLGPDSVTIVIPTRNRPDLLARCLDALARTVPAAAVRVVVVDDDSDEPAALALLGQLPARTDLRVAVIRAPRHGDGFNYSRLVNLGSARATTPLLLHLNNDVEALKPGWLEDLAGWLTVPGVGVAGPRLLYPDGTINHAGLSLGRDDGLPHALFEHEPAGDLGYLFLPHAARNVAAVTGACLLTRTDLYRELGGFDETDLRVAYNDVDFCLRARERGWRVVYSPQAELQHDGSATRGNSYTEREHVAFLRRHGGARDPYLSDALDFPPPAPRLDPCRHRPAATPRRFRAVAVTHNLQLEGAPILLCELVLHLAREAGATLRVLSPADGPLRARYESAGVPVEIVAAAPLTGAPDPAAFREALARFDATQRRDPDELVIANTLACFWAVHWARHAGRPSLLYVYESSAPGEVLKHTVPAPLHGLAADALRLATRVAFAAAATRAVHAEREGEDNFRTLPSWVDLDRVARVRAASDRAALRARHGIPPDVPLVITVGSVTERKGQHVLVHAVDLLRQDWDTQFPGKPLPRFLLIGARPSLYLETVQQDLALLGLEQTVRIVEETPDVDDYFVMADLLVCASFEESFPRVLLEAMAFGVRIVSTDVFGIPEMVKGNDEAVLVAAGDPFKLATGIRRALRDHWAGDTWMVSMASARVTRHFGAARLLPQHARLAREAWLTEDRAP